MHIARTPQNAPGDKELPPKNAQAGMRRAILPFKALDTHTKTVPYLGNCARLTEAVAQARTYNKLQVVTWPSGMPTAGRTGT